MVKNFPVYIRLKVCTAKISDASAAHLHIIIRWYDLECTNTLNLLETAFRCLKTKHYGLNNIAILVLP